MEQVLIIELTDHQKSLVIDAINGLSFNALQSAVKGEDVDRTYETQEALSILRRCLEESFDA